MFVPPFKDGYEVITQFVYGKTLLAICLFDNTRRLFSCLACLIKNPCYPMLFMNCLAFAFIICNVLYCW